MQFKNIVALIAAGAVTAMAFPAALPVEDSSLEARADQAKQADQNVQAHQGTQNAQVNQQAQTQLIKNAMAQVQSGQNIQLSQQQQQQAIQFATQQGAYTQSGQWVNPYTYWGGSYGYDYNDYLQYIYQLYLWYYLSIYGNNYNWNQYQYPCTPGFYC